MHPIRLAGLSLCVTALSACTVSDNALSPRSIPAFPARMEVLAGNTQSGVVAEELRDALVVRVVDSTGQAIAGQVVNFRVVSGGGQVFAGAAITNAEGRAAERWTLGTLSADSQRVEARAVNPATGERLTFATFSARAVPAGAAKLTRLSPDSQAVVAGAAVAVAPAVRAFDRYGNPAPGAIVRVRVVEGAGSVSDSVLMTDSTGRALLREWRAGPTAGRNTTRLLLSDTASVDFLATATAPPQQPTIALSTRSLLFTVTAGSGASAYQTVRVTNAGGGALTGLTGSFAYASSQAAGWLEGFFSGTSAPADASVRVVPGNLSPGTYGATVDIRASGATNAPQSIAVTLVVTAAAGGASPCSVVAGASVFADDGTFLGTLTNKYASNSVLNEFGTYGSPYSSTSIFNEYGRYGGEYASLSPFNPYTSRPPLLVKSGATIAYLTVNSVKTPRFDPRLISTCSFP